MKYFNITLIALGFIIAIVLIKYKPIYKVSVSGEQLGYVKNKEALEETIKEKAVKSNAENVDNIEIKETPEYELKLVNRTEETNEEEIAEAIQEDVVVTYKYYEVALNNKTIENVDNSEEAEELVNHIKEEKAEQELDLSIVEKYTENVEEVKTEEIEIAKTLAVEKERQRESERGNDSLCV